MSRKFLCGTLVAFAVVALSLPADAGRRHRRAHSTVCGGSAGTWFHFTSGGGSYVPFASEPVMTSYGGPPTHQQIFGRSHAQRSVGPAVHHVPSGCRTCGW